MDAHIGSGRPRCETWRAEIEKSPNVESLVTTVRQYLGLWTSEALAQLPAELASAALPACEAVYARAFLASQAELRMDGDDPRHPALRDMALVMAAAASRLQVLGSYESVARVRAANLVVPRGPRGRLEGEVRLTIVPK